MDDKLQGWGDIEAAKKGNRDIVKDEYQTIPGSGRVLVSRGKKDGAQKAKKQKRTFVSQRLDKRLAKVVTGSEIRAMEALLEYALDQLEANNHDLQI